ncbi:MAG: biotin--[acetyl-CoA-carboxylase] ligase [Candidatus Omnitrophica bacterium CG11_big_fil_rev_8_21_14_0_20_63_9]|nr:MAG: biotin--[acetyl-CoA-carboxylase] ligase [Candidatus Omnitrophica bacterium CG11_big_fil_rev_8_21_14_0_20_63_9]
MRDTELETRIAKQLGAAKLGRPVHAFHRINSTMEAAHALAAEGAPEGALVWALQQEQGRGRQGRAWASPEGGAYFSLVLRPKRSPTEIPQLALVAGLAAAETLRDVACAYPAIRWPNDLLVNNKKLGGILVEAKSGAVVIGVGINVTTEPSQLPPEAISLAMLAAGHVSREELIAGFCQRLSHWYEEWREEGFVPIRAALRPWMGLFGRLVDIANGKTRFEGTAQDVDEQGRLVVRLDSGILRAFDMGEVTLLRQRQEVP